MAISFTPETGSGLTGRQILPNPNGTILRVRLQEMVLDGLMTGNYARYLTSERSTLKATPGCETTTTHEAELPEPRVSTLARINPSFTPGMRAVPAASLPFPAQRAGSMKQAPDLLP